MKVVHPVSRRKHERRDGPQPSVQELIDQVVVVFSVAGISIRPSKISRLVRTFTYRPASNGYEFADYMVNALALTVLQRKQVIDELARVVTYHDPTGEQATNRVMRERKQP